MIQRYAKTSGRILSTERGQSIRKWNSSKRRKDTVKSFYYGEGELKFSKIKLFKEWIDSKENIGSFDNDNE